MGADCQLCCSGDEEIEQIKCGSTKAVFTSLCCTDHTETTILPVHVVARQCSATETAPVELQESAC